MHRRIRRARALALGACLGAVAMLAPARAQGASLRWIRPYTGQMIAVDPSTQRVFILTDSGVTTLQAQTGALLQQVALPGAGTWGPAAIDAQVGHAVLLRSSGGSGAQVILLDTRTGGVLHTTTLPVAASSLVEDTSTQRVYVAETDSAGTIAVVDVRTGQMVDALQAGAPAQQVAIDAAGDRLFVVSATSTTPDARGTLSAIDLATHTVVGAVQVGRGPHALAVDDATGRVIVSNAADRTISVVDSSTMRLIATAIATIRPAMVLADAAHARAYVLDPGSGQPAAQMSANTVAATVDVLDTRTGAVLVRIPIGVPAETMALDRRTGTLFVATAYATPVNTSAAPPTTVVGGIRIVATGDRPIIHSVLWPAATAPVALAMDETDGRVYILAAGSTTTAGGTVAGFSAMLDEARL